MVAVAEGRVIVVPNVLREYVLAVLGHDLKQHLAAKNDAR
jgi:CO dehydrogenase/acetyl-CoA synthase beta subunit